MEDNKKELFELTQCWNELRLELRKNKKIDFDVFEEAFSKTYFMLSGNATETVVEKKYIELISTVYLFANAESKELSSKCRAALALTERMINCCAFNTTPDVVSGTTIYIFEARKDVYIDFNNLSDSIEELEKLFEDDFWRNV